MATVKGRIDYDKIVREDRLHASIYYDPEIFDDEMEKIWHKGWVYVGHESEVAEPGDYITKKLGLQPVIMSRDETGQIHLLFNRCLHRGNTVCQSEHGSAFNFRCAYHGWTYSNNGDLIGVTQRDAYTDEQLAELKGLAHVARVSNYGGFVWGSLSPDGPSLEEHLGPGGRWAIDALNALSPKGKVEITGGGLKHRYRANWKMLYEAQVDGYHPFYAHQSILEGRADMRGTRGEGGADNRPIGLRYLGNGHTTLELDQAARATGRMFTWLGKVPEELSKNYVAAMEELHGPEKARDILMTGPPHVNIWPNLMLAEMNLFIIQPVAADRSIQLDQPIFIKGVPELKERILRWTEGAVGPAGFLLADDGEMFQRNFRGFQARSPEWVLLNRGMHRESVDEHGYVGGYSADDAHYRRFWGHYRQIMNQPN